MSLAPPENEMSKTSNLCLVIGVWSAGVILYVMLAGFPPFYGDSPTEIFEAVARGNLRFPAQAFRSVSPVARDLIRRMLCKDVSRRFSAEQVLMQSHMKYWMLNFQPACCR